MRHECRACYRTFTSLHSRWQHESAIHPYQCGKCDDAIFNNEQDLDDHIDEEHTVWHACAICPDYGRSSRFRSERALDQHVQDAAGHRNYCYGCKRAFTSTNALAQHLKSSVHVGRNVKCPWCPAMFVNLTGVTHHLESNVCPSGITRAQIDTFVRQADTRHVITNKLLTYTGYDTNIVETVATSASWNGSGYQCYLCNREFGALNALNQHLSSPTHEQKKYHYPKCPTEFVRLAGLVNHLESETCGVFRFDLQRGFVAGAVQRMIAY